MLSRALSNGHLVALLVFICTFCLTTDASSADQKNKHKRQKKPSSKTALEPTKGFAEMVVLGVMPTQQGHAVVLALEEEKKLLPIWIGDAEAFSIQLRLDRRRFQRPLTHDLLDAVMRDLGGHLLKIHIDDLKGNTFVGTLFIRQADRVIHLDARPSDSIALAIGNQVPIYVSKSVIERAAITQKETEPAPRKKEGKNSQQLLKEMLDAQRDEHTL